MAEATWHFRSNPPLTSASVATTTTTAATNRCFFVLHLQPPPLLPSLPLPPVSDWMVAVGGARRGHRKWSEFRHFRPENHDGPICRNSTSRIQPPRQSFLILVKISVDLLFPCQVEFNDHFPEYLITADWLRMAGSLSRWGRVSVTQLRPPPLDGSRVRPPPRRREDAQVAQKMAAISGILFRLFI